MCDTRGQIIDNRVLLTRYAVRVAGWLGSGLLLLFFGWSPAQTSSKHQALSDSTPFGAAVRKGKEEVKHGLYLPALNDYEMAVKLAHDSGDASLESHALLMVMGTEIRLFRYRDAIVASERIDRLTHDNEVLGAKANNLATVYSQLGDYQRALHSAEQAVACLKQSDRPDFTARALLNLGDILASLKNTPASISAYRESISLAHSAGNNDVQAEAHLGQSLTDARAARILITAGAHPHDLRLRQHDTDGLALVYENLASLAYAEHAYDDALHLLDIASTSGSRTLRIIPPYEFVNLRGKILLKLGREADALNWFYRAVLLADKWLQNEPPGDVTNIRTAVSLHQLYQDYILLAARLSLLRHDPDLASRALRVQVYHRAVTLRQQSLAFLQKNAQLPPRYFELLGQLQQYQARVTLGNPGPERERYQRQLGLLREQLATLETRAGLAVNGESEGNFDSSVGIVQHLQQHLHGDQMLLIYNLAHPNSYVWALNRSLIQLRELNSDDRIAAAANRFREAVESSRPFQSQGLTLAKEMFPALPPGFYSQPRWKLVLDGALLDGIPLSCLPDLADKQPALPLVASHSLAFLPGSMMMIRSIPLPLGGIFVGVGDPVYNLADPRHQTTANASTSHASGALTLARLVGTAQEVRNSSQAVGADKVRLLLGADASLQQLRTALRPTPTILHFALHVISPNTSARALLPSGDEAGLALSLTSQNIPEIITKEVVDTLRVPGTLVVLSGCASQQGEILPSAGVIGLSRAWLLAGASSVVVSSWPTPDSSGQFFVSFYRHLRQQPKSLSLADRAATALQSAENDMRSLPGYQNAPSYWAAYSVISGGS